jgi:hypothetical protein
METPSSSKCYALFGSFDNPFLVIAGFSLDGEREYHFIRERAS